MYLVSAGVRVIIAPIELRREVCVREVRGCELWVWDECVVGRCVGRRYVGGKCMGNNFACHSLSVRTIRPNNYKYIVIKLFQITKNFNYYIN